MAYKINIYIYIIMGNTETDQQEKKIYVFNHDISSLHIPPVVYGRFLFYFLEEQEGGDIKAIILNVKRCRYIDINNEIYKPQYFKFKVLEVIKDNTTENIITIKKDKYNEYLKNGQLIEYNKDVIYIDILDEFLSEKFNMAFYIKWSKILYNIHNNIYNKDDKICEACDIQILSLKGFKRHIKGKKHHILKRMFNYGNIEDEKALYIYMYGLHSYILK